jgi:hypothetical protein
MNLHRIAVLKVRDVLDNVDMGERLKQPDFLQENKLGKIGKIGPVFITYSYMAADQEFGCKSLKAPSSTQQIENFEILES